MAVTSEMTEEVLIDSVEINFWLNLCDGKKKEVVKSRLKLLRQSEIEGLILKLELNLRFCQLDFTL